MTMIFKKIGIGFLLFVWMILTIIAPCTIIGLVLLIGEDGRTTWQDIGIELVKGLKEKQFYD